MGDGDDVLHRVFVGGTGHECGFTGHGFFHPDAGGDVLEGEAAADVGAVAGDEEGAVLRLAIDDVGVLQGAAIAGPAAGLVAGQGQAGEFIHAGGHGHRIGGFGFFRAADFLALAGCGDGVVVGGGGTAVLVDDVEFERQAHGGVAVVDGADYVVAVGQRHVGIAFLGIAAVFGDDGDIADRSTAGCAAAGSAGNSTRSIRRGTGCRAACCALRGIIRADRARPGARYINGFAVAVEQVGGMQAVAAGQHLHRGHGRGASLAGKRRGLGISTGSVSAVAAAAVADMATVTCIAAGAGIAAVSSISSISIRSAMATGYVVVSRLAGQRPRGAQREIGSRVAAAVAVGDGVDEREGGGSVRVGDGAAGPVTVEQGQGRGCSCQFRLALFAALTGDAACPAAGGVAGQGRTVQCPDTGGHGGGGYGGVSAFAGFSRGRFGAAIGLLAGGGQCHVIVGVAAAVGVADRGGQRELRRRWYVDEVVMGGRLAPLERNVADQLFGAAGIAARAACPGAGGGVALAGRGDARQSVLAATNAVEAGQGRAAAVAVGVDGTRAVTGVCLGRGAVGGCTGGRGAAGGGIAGCGATGGAAVR